MRNSREMEGLAAISHATTSAGYGAILLGAGAVIAGNLLGRPWNRARGNGFEYHFHSVGLAVVGTAAAFALIGIGVHSLATAAHKRDAEEWP